jgi:hypothetical protein
MDDEILKTRISDYLVERLYRHDISSLSFKSKISKSRYLRYMISNSSLMKNKMSDTFKLTNSMMSDYNLIRSFTWLANDYNCNDAVYLDKEKQNIL